MTKSVFNFNLCYPLSKVTKQLIHAHWEEGRTSISRHLCQQWNWRQPNGQLKDQVCRLLLLKLEKEGHILLPPRKISPNNKQRAYYRRHPEVLQQISIQPIEGSLKQLMPIEIRQVRKTPEEPLWNELVHQYHYLHHRILVGSHLQYIAYAHGRPIACLGWGAAIWAVLCRDTLKETCGLRSTTTDSSYSPGFSAKIWAPIC